MGQNVLKKWWSFLVVVSIFAAAAYLKGELNTELYVTGKVELETHTQQRRYPLAKLKTSIKPKVEPNQSPIILLEWYKPFGQVRPDVNLKSCGGCIYTQNRSKIMEENTKAVVMHFVAVNTSTMPRKRRTDQSYVWMTMESPLTLFNRHMHLEKLDGIFNLSATYRKDSDVRFPYMYAFSAYRMANSGLKPKSEAQLDELIKQKTHIALWVASNCNTNKGAIERLKYARQMIRDGLNLTFGGRCSGDRERKQYNYTKYKFYLAFENSWGCNDYITEKFWKNSLAAGTVPVVIGPPKADYEAVAPPNSFIYAQDFATPKQLVKYLQYLDKNDNAYKQYLVWTTLHISQMPGDIHSNFRCHLCKYIRDLEDRRKNKSPPIMSSLARTNYSLAKWLFGNESKECFF